jgi:hypothetical protein
VCLLRISVFAPSSSNALPRANINLPRKSRKSARTIPVLQTRSRQNPACHHVKVNLYHILARFLYSPCSFLRRLGDTQPIMASDNGFAHQSIYTILLCVRTSSRLGVTRACQERWYRVNHICAPYSQTYTTVYIRKVRCAAAWKPSINRTFIFALYAPKKSWRRLTSPTLLLDGYLDIFHFLQQAPSYCKFEWAEASCMLFCAGIVLFAPRPQIKGQRSRLAGGAGPLLPLAGARGRSDSSGVWLSASPLGR